MKKRILFISALLSSLFSFAQNFEWAHSFGLASGWDDEARCVAVDYNGNVYITGNFQFTIDFDPSPTVANLTAVGNQDIFFAKYDKNGIYIWAKNIGSTTYDSGESIAVDDSGNVYISGYAQGTADFDPGAGTANFTFMNSFFAKYDSNGNYIWAKAIPNGYANLGPWITVMENGNLLVTSSFVGTSDFDPSPGVANLTSKGMQDAYIARYDPSGNYVWAIGMGSVKDEFSYSVTTDQNMNIYISGEFSDTADFDPGVGVANIMSTGGIYSDIFFAKYDMNGNYIWAKGVGSKSIDKSNSISVDTIGCVYITGYFRDTADFDPGPGIVNLISAGSGSRDIFFAKYDLNGNYLWANRIGSASSSEEGTAIAVSNNSSNLGVYITGEFIGTSDFDPDVGTAILNAVGNGEAFIAKYDTSGNFIYATSIAGSFSDKGLSIAVDKNPLMGGVYTTGYFQGTYDFDPGICSELLTGGVLKDIFLVKYSNFPPAPVSICIITVDSTSTKNVIVWEKPVTTNIDSFRIYREISSVFTPIITRHYDSLSIYTDTDASVNPNFSAYQYKISAIDTNGIESPLSARHETMWLQVTQPNPPMYDLLWTDYCGFPVTKYYIVRDSNNTNFWVRIDSVNFGTNVYVDSFPPTDSAAYRIEADIPTPCNVSIKNPLPVVTTIKSTRSNSYKTTSLGVHDAVLDKNVIVYPNPSSGKFKIYSSGFKIRNLEVYNLYGEKIYSSSGIQNSLLEIDLSAQPNGIYFVKLISSAGTVVKKVVVTR